MQKKPSGNVVTHVPVRNRVYSLKRKSWTRIESFTFSNAFRADISFDRQQLSKSMSFSGALYWVAANQLGYEEYLKKFEFSYEIFKKIRLP